MNWKEEKVIVLGGGGFLGKQILKDLLDLGAKNLTSYGRHPQPELTEMGVKVICGDIRDQAKVIEACKGQSIIFHTAAKAGVWGSWKEYYGINVTGTENVIEASKENDIRYLIYTSSPSVAYSPTENIENVDESIGYPNKYLAHYPHTKAIAEKLVINANCANLKTVSLRPHLLWGEGDPHLVPRILEKARSGKLKIIGDGQNLVDITHICNASKAHILAAERLQDCDELCSGKAYFISDGKPVNLWKWVNELLERNEIEKLQKSISYKKVYMIGAVLETLFLLGLSVKKEPPMTRFVAGQLAHSHYFDISKSESDFNYSPSNFS